MSTSIDASGFPNQFGMFDLDVAVPTIENDRKMNLERWATIQINGKK